MTRDAWLQNLWIIVALGLVLGAVVHGARSERWQRAWLRLRGDRLGVAAGLVIAFYLFLGALEMLQIPVREGGVESVLTRLTRRIPSEESYSAPLAATLLSVKNPQPVRGRHLLGTDALGKDVFVQALRACRTALIIGGLTSVIYIPLGALIGIFAGYFRGWVDDVIQFVYTVLYSIPEILLLISILLVLGEKSLTKMSFALAITAWVSLCRLIRGETMRQTERPYIAAARALGQSHWRIVTRHLLPNVMHLVLIQLVLGFSNLVLAEAMLSYLGVGSPIGTPSWGNMIDGARGELSREPIVWWTLTAATAALFGLVLSLNVFGDALRRAFDPRRG
jgi:peptide/nickel transport system permease protein